MNIILLSHKLHTHTITTILILCDLERAGHQGWVSGLISWPIGKRWSGQTEADDGLITYKPQPSLSSLRKAVQPKNPPKKVVCFWFS